MSHRYFGLVVPFAVTMTVFFVRRLPGMARLVSVTQCIPAPVSPSHMALPLATLSAVGMACMIAV
eukprot:4512111-Pleurochrysis_carterae.AAC.1